MKNYTYIDNDEALIEFRKYLYYNNINNISMDFEGEFNLHAYGAKLCLIQIFDGEKYFIIDPLNITSEEIVKTLSNKKIIKYMYGVESDINLIYKQYGIKLDNVYDQKILVDVLEIKPCGLDDIIKKLLNIEIKNKTKYQKYNWLKRPINKDALEYSLNDVMYLFEINKILINMILSENKLNYLILKFIKRNNYNFDKERIPRLFKNTKFKILTEDKKILVKELFSIREEYAELFNVPANNIIKNDVLFDIVNNDKKIDEIDYYKMFSKKERIEIKNKFIKVMKKA